MSPRLQAVAHPGSLLQFASLFAFSSIVALGRHRRRKDFQSIIASAR